MTHHPHTPHPDADLPAALRMQLRGLRTEMPPSRDLWAGIAARLDEQAPAPAAAPPVRHVWRPFPALATAAVLALAIGAAWQLRPDTARPEPAAALPSTSAASPASPLLLREAQAMTREYEGALRELPAPAAAAEENAVLAQLDASATAVRAALAEAPDARFLLGQLQRIYSQRLSLTRHLARA